MVCLWVIQPGKTLRAKLVNLSKFGTDIVKGSPEYADRSGCTDSEGVPCSAG